MNFYFFLAFVIVQRILELIVAKQNEKWARAQGAVEYGKGHYPWIVVLHTAFIISMYVEYVFHGAIFRLAFLLIFFLLIAFKIWTIASLGKYWNTRILRIPGSAFVKKGPYKYFRHPNYFIVICEIIVIPMVFDLWYTAIIFSILNAIMLYVRIREEEKVWKEV